MERYPTTSVENQMDYFSDRHEPYPASNLSENNKKHIHTIKQFNALRPNWDSYNANQPSSIAIDKAINFVLYLSEKNIDIFFAAPTPDGDILVELKNNDVHLEFVFSEVVANKIIASMNNDFLSEADLSTSQVVNKSNC